jgi:hypothetical protein
LKYRTYLSSYILVLVIKKTGMMMMYGMMLAAAAPLPAEISPEPPAERPHRMLEFGVDGGAYAANNLLSLGDIFNVRKTATVDLINAAVREFAVGAGGGADVFFNLNFPNGYGIGVFAGIDGVFYGTASESLMRLLGRGNADSGSSRGDIDMGGSVFAEAGVKAAGEFNRFRLAVKPAVFVPILFIPASRAGYSVDTDESGVKARGLLDLDVYSVYALGEETGPYAGSGEVFPIGFDISAGGEYALMPRMDLGVSISHLPVFPARMSHRARVESEYAFEIDGALDSISDGNIELPDPELSARYDNNTVFYAFRSPRFNSYIQYRLLDSGLFAVRPSLGFSFLPVFGYAFCLNAGIEGRINILEIFSAALSAAYTERIWAYNLRLMLNFHAAEIIFNVSLRGTDIASAFGAKGLGMSLGLRFGF